MYKLIEEDVRRATELERFIHENHEINASQLAVDMFRIRQLTGLDELERKILLFHLENSNDFQPLFLRAKNHLSDS